MRFESVTAYAFGRFQNETLELSPGMNVLYGSNEAGKSTWHAALYAGLCGMRRGRGRATREDSDFRARHKPWDDEGWEVGATIALEGRRVVLRHDLGGRVDSSARDADLANRDYSAEIVKDGAPDGAFWLGLDRRSFLSTACVRQASVLAVLEDPADLQDELQRAAATARTGETAADALKALSAYRAEHVGTARAPTRPLARSRRELREARAALTSAEGARAEAATGRRRLEEIESEVLDLERKRDATRAVLAGGAATAAEQRLVRARALSAQGEPRHPADDGDLAERVTRALEQWSNAPQPEEPTGQTVSELRALLAAEYLDVAILAEREASVAEERLARARELSASFPEGSPKRPSEEDDLTQEIANALAAWDARPAVNGTSVRELRDRLKEIDAAASHTRRGGLAGALRAIVQWLARLFRLAPRASGRFAQTWQSAAWLSNGEIEDAARGEEAGVAISNAARRAGVPDGPPDVLVHSLREWQLARAERMAEADARLGVWEQLQRVLGEQTLAELDADATRLRSEAEARAAAVDRGELDRALPEPPDGTVLAELRERTSDARRAGTESRLHMRVAEDERFEEALGKRDAASSGLREAAAAIGSDAVTPHDQESALIGWLKDRSETLAEHRRRADDWEELQRLLGERTLAEVEAEALRLRSEADSLVGVVRPDEIDQARADEPAAEDLENIEATLGHARARRDTALGQVAEFEARLPDLAEVQERVSRSEVEVARVEGLNGTLSTAIQFLEAAQERVHRNIAPVLRATVLERLAQVTGGRYTDCRVDPESLQVEVAGPDRRWRQARLLSHGTAEQLYLLLRAALARHLTEPAGEACPLILDDVVSAADGKRKRRLLETLLSMSESTQVILFTHEDDVRSWACGATHRRERPPPDPACRGCWRSGIAGDGTVALRVHRGREPHADTLLRASRPSVMGLSTLGVRA